MRTEDGYIISKCLNGDSEAFGFLVDKYRESVYAFAYSRLRNFDDAEDVAQEVFIKAYRKLRTLRRWDNFLAWLYSITSNLCKDWIRTQSRRPDHEFMEDNEPEIVKILSIGSYRDGLAIESLRESVQEALDSLPEIHRQVLILHYLGGMSSMDIARFLGTSRMTILQRLHRARAQMKEEMLAMMSTTFESQRLPVGFTLRIVEIVKRIKIQPMPRTAGLPWGLSLAAGIVLTVMSLSAHLSILNPMSIPTSAPFPVEAKVLKAGEIPVDIMEVSNELFIANRQADSNGGEFKPPNSQNAALMAAPGAVDTWTEGTDMPVGRTRLSTCVVDGIIYAIGGRDAGIPELSAVEAYDPAKNTWVKKADMPTARQWLSTCVVDGIIYAIGGAQFHGVPVWKSIPKVEAYDPSRDEWETKADMPTHREGITTSVVDGIIYAIGGFKDGSGVGLPTVEAYDPVEDRWEKKTDMPVGICFHTASVVDGEIYVIGGKTADGADWGNPCSEKVAVYDPARDMWDEMNGTMPSPRADHAASVVNGIIYTFGGTAFPPDNQEGLHIVEAYDPVTDTWTTKAEMPTARMLLSSSAVGGRIYAIGGTTRYLGVILPTVEIYDTGFLPPAQGSSVRPKGKFITAWGEVKSD